MQIIKWAKRCEGECGAVQTTSDAATGRGLAFSPTATAQTRTRKTAGTNSEIFCRGGASARVLEAKPSPFLMFLRSWRENRRTRRFARAAFAQKRLKVREPKICKKRVGNLVTKRILFNTTF